METRPETIIEILINEIKTFFDIVLLIFARIFVYNRLFNFARCLTVTQKSIDPTGRATVHTDHSQFSRILRFCRFF